MEFGRHIGKGVWALGDKALPAIYGVGYIFLIARVFPKDELGAYAVVQTIFNILNSATATFAVQPIVKFAAETDSPGPYLRASLTIQVVTLVLVTAVFLLGAGTLAHLLDPGHEVNLTGLLYYVPLLLFASLYRNFGVALLQVKYQVQKIFWIDVVYFLGILLCIFVARAKGAFNTAGDVLALGVIVSCAASVVALILTRREMSVPLKATREAFRQMWHFGKYMFGGSVTYTLYSQVDVFFVSSFAGPTGVATYFNAKIFTRIFDMVSQVMQMFLVPLSSKLSSQKEWKQLSVVAEKSICFSTLFLLPVVLLMVVFPREVLHILFAGKYDQAASIVRIFGIIAFISPWQSLASSYLIGTGKVREGFYFGLLMLCVAVPSYAILTRLLNADGTALAMVITLGVTTVVTVRYLRKFISLSVGETIMHVKDVWTFVRTRAKGATQG